MTQAEEDAIIGVRVVTPDLNRTDVAVALKTIEDKFGLDWLTDSAYHPIRGLWLRGDFIALQELFTLGDSTVLIEAVDQAWVADAVRQVKSFDRNNRAGYVFEIVAIAAMMRAGAKVTPAPHNTEGYDCETVLPSGDLARISLKNFGESTREAGFRKKARCIAAHVRAIAGKRNPRWFGVFAECSTYPTDFDWEQLEDAITASRRPADRVDKGNWEIVFTPSPTPANELATSFTSFATQIVAPHHKNEAKNFIDSMAGACWKLGRVASAQGATVRPIVLIRLSESADIVECTAWAKDYLDRVPSPNVDGVFLVQSTVAQNLRDGSSSISHNVDGAWKPGVPTPGLTIAMLVGVTSTNPTHSILMAGESKIALDGKHWFSDRHVYRFAPVDPATGATANVHQVPGHVTHGVFRSPGGEELALSPKHVTPAKLTMYS